MRGGKTIRNGRRGTPSSAARPDHRRTCCWNCAARRWRTRRAIPDGTRPGVTCCFSGPTTGFPRIEHRQLMRVEHHSRDRLPGLFVALLAGLHKGILTSTPVNDDYQHLAYGRQMLAGDLPLKDFWDLSTTLQASTSAAAQVLFGHRLLAEAIVVGVATAIAVYLV